MGRSSKTVKMAELPMRFTLLHENGWHMLREFLCADEEPAADIRVTEEQLLEKHSWIEPGMGMDEIEYLYILRKTADALLLHDRCIFHGVAFIWRGRAYIFTAPSGTGKSTQYVLWKLRYGEEIQLINGDKPILRRMEDGSIHVYSSPWRGKENIGTMQSAPLGGIVLLEQGRTDAARRATPVEAVTELYNEMFFLPYSEEAIDRACRMEEAILNSVPVWVFTNRGVEGTAEVLHDYILADEGAEHEV